MDDLAQTENVTAFPGGAAAEALAEKPAELRRHDFRQKISWSERHQRTLRQEHEDFASSLAALLSIYLRSEFALQITRLETAPFAKFTQSLEPSSHLVLFKIDPKSPTCLFELSRRLALAFVDRLMGGPGKAEDAQRELTSIETSLLEQVAQMVINEWCGHWAMERLKPLIIGHETNPAFLRTSTPDATTFILGMEASFGELVEQVQLAIPYCAVMELLADPCVAEAAAEAVAAKPLAWRPEFDEVEVRLDAEWEINHLPARAFASLKIGDILDLDPESIEEVAIKIGDVRKFAGRFGVQGSKRAVQITAVKLAA